MSWYTYTTELANNTMASRHLCIERIIHYHDQTKHSFQKHSRSLGYMDWKNQPNPFRYFKGTEKISCPPLTTERSHLSFEAVLQRGAVPPADMSLQSISQFLHLAFGVTAWKQAGQSHWALRSNPSSGNLHPTESYVITSSADGLSPGLYHYGPKDHMLERRAAFNVDHLGELLDSFPRGSFLVGLSSIHWRESWKYGERAFRYCNLDVGHAIASTRVAAAVMGWNIVVLDGLRDEIVAALLGTDRDADFIRAEGEHAELLAAVWPQLDVGCGRISSRLPIYLNKDVVKTVVESGEWFGKANKLSRKHEADWDIIEDVSTASQKNVNDLTYINTSNTLVEGFCMNNTKTGISISAEKLIRQRRSAINFDETTSMTLSDFFSMLFRVLPYEEAPFSSVSYSDESGHHSKPIPWDSWPHNPTIHLLLFVHRVEGLESGIYFLVRDMSRFSHIKESFDKSLPWIPISNGFGIPLYYLYRGNVRSTAQRLSCNQNIAADGAFSIGMLAEFDTCLSTIGPWWYRRMYWEAGILGHIMYLEAEAIGLRATGIGCFFDDPVHDLLKILPRSYQSLYHLAVGGPVVDSRLIS